MPPAPFDTWQAYKSLKASGLADVQADAIVNLLAKVADLRSASEDASPREPSPDVSPTRQRETEQLVETVGSALASVTRSFRWNLVAAGVVWILCQAALDVIAP